MFQNELLPPFCPQSLGKWSAAILKTLSNETKRGRGPDGRGSTICCRLLLGNTRLLVQGGTAGGTRGRKDKGHIGHAGRERVQADFRDGGPGLGTGRGVLGGRGTRAQDKAAAARPLPARGPAPRRAPGGRAREHERAGNGLEMAVGEEGGDRGGRKRSAGVPGRPAARAPPRARVRSCFLDPLSPTAPALWAPAGPGGVGGARSVNKGGGQDRRCHCGA